MQRGSYRELSFHQVTGYIDLRRTANALFFLHQTRDERTP